MINYRYYIKNLFKGITGLSVVIGIGLLIRLQYVEPMPSVYNIKLIGHKLYQAQVTCSWSTLRNLLDACGTKYWIIPPNCITLDEESKYQSWGPVVFECPHDYYLTPYLTIEPQYDIKATLWNFGLILITCPILALLLLSQVIPKRCLKQRELDI